MNEIEQLKKDILKLEFQHKKDRAESEKQFNERNAEIQAKLDDTNKQLNHITKRLNHITKLTGISFENFADIDSTFAKVSKATARKK